MLDVFLILPLSLSLRSMCGRGSSAKKCLLFVAALVAASVFCPTMFFIGNAALNAAKPAAYLRAFKLKAAVQTKTYFPRTTIFHRAFTLIATTGHLWNNVFISRLYQLGSLHCFRHGNIDRSLLALRHRGQSSRIPLLPCLGPPWSQVDQLVNWESPKAHLGAGLPRISVRVGSSVWT